MRSILSLLLLLAGSTLLAQTSFPMITHVTPVAVQRGTSVEVVVEGQMNFDGTHQFLIEGDDVSAEILPGPAATPPKKGTGPAVVRSVKLKLTAAKDAALGVREFRLATRLGISSIGQLVIVADPVVVESADNNTAAKAQTIAVPSVVCGRIEVAEDVDCFKFRAKAGQTLTFDVYCARIQDKIHDLQKHADPLIAIFDAEGRELNASDDGNFADPLLTHTFKQDGDYVLQVRDAKYDGDPRWAYALHITDKPYAAQIFPLGMNPGKSVTVEPVGSARLISGKVETMAPKQLGIQSLQLQIGGERTNPVACVVTDLPIVTETEPNDSRGEAQLVPIPSAINGRIGKRRDSDFFRFKGTKGQAIRFEVFARRFSTILNSQLDSYLEILNAQGAVLLANDDLNGKDAGLVFTPPADGEYFIRLRDLNNKGGDGFVYLLECDFAKPDFSLKCDSSKAMIGPGSRTAWYVQVARQNGFAGPVKVEVKGLPKEISVNTLTIPPTMTQGLLVLYASPDAAKPVGANVEIFGTAEVASADGKKQTIVRKSVGHEEIYLPGGGRGRFDVRMQSVALTEASDILDVAVKPEKLVLKPGEEIKLDVTVTRRKDYDKTISIDVPLRHLGQVFANPLPPGVTLVEEKSKTLLGTGNVGHIVLKADATAAEIDDVPICVLTHVSINFVVKISYSSKPILLSIRK